MSSSRDLMTVYKILVTFRPFTASIERIHSLFTGIMTKNRNRMNKEVLCKLVFIKANEMFGSLKEKYKMNEDLNKLVKEEEEFEAFCESTIALQVKIIDLDSEVHMEYPNFVEEVSSGDMFDEDDVLMLELSNAEITQ